ncbi:MAG: hypothetical protein AB7N76_06955 [Planctomycetota bacterium]
MTTIRSDAKVSDGAGNHGQHSYSYVSFERVLDAFEVLRRLNAAYGYYQRGADGRETFNLGADRGGLSPARQAEEAPSGLALPYTLGLGDQPKASPPRTERKTLRPRVRVLDAHGNPLPRDGAGELLRSTNGGESTLNALARALAEGRTDAEGFDAPQLTDGWLPEAFANYWTVQGAPQGQEAEWGQGAARALQAFNLGAQVDPLKLLRGDALQLGASKSEPLLGQPAFAYGVRRVRAGEVRFVYVSSQPDTFGVGVPLNDLARRGLLPPELGLVFRASLRDEEGTALADHRYEVEVSGQTFEGRSDKDGRLEIALPTQATTGTLRFWLDEGSEDEEEIEWPLRFKKKAPQASEEHDGDPEQAHGEGEDQSFDGRHDPTQQDPSRKREDEVPAGVTRKEFVVSRSGPPAEVYVYHPDPFDSPRFVTHALRYGKWQVMTKGDDGYELFHPWHGVAYASRPNAEFPRYPLPLGGTCDLEYSTKSTTGEGWVTVPLAQTLSRYYRNTEELKGGYFPLGRSRTWHGGVHLAPEEDFTVCAPFDGRVVAARLCAYEELREGQDPRYPFGSPNFILLKHGVEVGGKEHEFFTLLMHLDPVPMLLMGEEQVLTPEAARLPWLREIALAPDRPEEEARLQPLDWHKLYLEVTGLPEGGFKLGAKEDGTGGSALQLGDFLEVAGPEVSELQWQLYNGNKHGEVKLVRDGTTGDLDPEDFLRLGGALMPVDAFPVRYVELKKKLLAGEVVDLWEEKLVVRAGEPLGQVGQWHTARRLHVEVFSKDLIPVKVAGKKGADGQPEMSEKKAVDLDTAADPSGLHKRISFLEKFFEEVEKKGNEADGLDGKDLGLRVRERMLRDVISEDDGKVLLESEVQAFFNDPDNSLLPLFRNLVVRHVSEWGTKAVWDQKLGDAATELGDPLKAKLDAVGKLGARYAWWTDGFAKDSGLPQDQVAHYYHPITFLRWLEHERLGELAKGGASKLHQSVFDLNHDIFEEGGGPGPDAGTQHLKLSLADEDGEALEGCRYELKVCGQVFTGTSGAKGKIEHDVPAEAIEGELTFWVDDEESYTWPLRIR